MLNERATTATMMMAKRRLTKRRPTMVLPSELLLM